MWRSFSRSLDANILLARDRRSSQVKHPIAQMGGDGYQTKTKEVDPSEVSILHYTA